MCSAFRHPTQAEFDLYMRRAHHARSAAFAATGRWIVAKVAAAARAAVGPAPKRVTSPLRRAH